jgi:hypothetical protein
MLAKTPFLEAFTPSIPQAHIWNSFVYSDDCPYLSIAMKAFVPVAVASQARLASVRTVVS